MVLALPTTISTLPNEILINILSLLPTRQLLPITTVNRRTHDIILRIIHHRLLAAASIADHQIILEYFHPSAKITTPYYICDYLGTDPLEEDPEYPSPNLQRIGSLGKLRNLYSHFRPVQPEAERKVWTPGPAGGWLPATLEAFGGKREGCVTQNVDLESYELFSQLQSVVSLVKAGPSQGFFASCVTIGEGLTRVWRDWLSDRASAKSSPEEHNKSLLWSSVREHIGLRLGVTKRDVMAAPSTRSRDEDEDVAYTLHYEELVVRTSEILLSLEESYSKEVNNSGLLCGLDGVYISGIYKGRMVEESLETYWRPVVDAYAGHLTGRLPVLIGW